MRQVAIPEPGIEICGLPWFAHNGEKLWRLPKELQGQVSEALWAVSQNTSGARLRFASDTADLGIAANYAAVRTVSRHDQHLRHRAERDGPVWGGEVLDQCLAAR